MNLKILMFNNRIYGLTKGQYSPTSELGKVTKSTPMGSLDHPFNPLSLAIGAEATFVARAIDTDKKELTEVLRAAAHHKGSAFVEIYQNCNIYNDNAFDFVREQKENRLYLRHGEPIVWGEKGVRLLPDGSPEVVGASEPGLLIDDAHAAEPAHAFALSRMTQTVIGATPMGVFRAVERPVYDELMAEQIGVAQAKGEGGVRGCRSPAAILGASTEVDTRAGCASSSQCEWIVRPLLREDSTRSAGAALAAYEGSGSPSPFECTSAFAGKESDLRCWNDRLLPEPLNTFARMCSGWARNRGEGSDEV